MKTKIYPSTIISLSLVGIVAASFTMLTSSPVSAELSTSSTAKVTVGENCSMTSTVDTAHTANLVNGTYSGTNYADGIGQTTLKVFCNDSAGFALYAIGYTNDEYGNTTLHWTRANSADENANAINTGIYTAGSTESSTWSMKLTAVSGIYSATIDDGLAAHNDSTEDYTSWHEIPNEYQRVAYRTAGTDVEISGAGIGSSVTTTYDAYVSNTQPSGTYVGQVKYTLVHPSSHADPVRPLKDVDCPANSICYAPNADDVIGTMNTGVQDYPRLYQLSVSPIAGRQIETNDPSGSVINISSSSSVELIAPNYAREGYGFAGWSTEFDATTATNPTIYGPNETITLPDVSESGLVLYPVWIASTGNLQDWSGCSSLTAASYDSDTGKTNASLNSITALTDTRDNKVYTVARLADGKCWMAENLRLNSEDSRGEINAAKAQGYAEGGIYGSFIGLADSEDTTIGNDDSPNSIYAQDNTATVNIGTTNYPKNRMPRYNDNNSNLANGATNSNGALLVDAYSIEADSARWYGYGNYYTWAAAMANTRYYALYQSVSHQEYINSDAAGTSICPKGWQLPLGDASTGNLNSGSSDAANRVGGFSYLDRIMGGDGLEQASAAQSNKWRSFPNNYTFSGQKGYYHGDAGIFWTRSAQSSDTAHVLRITNNNVYPSGFNVAQKYFGLSIRCVLE